MNDIKGFTFFQNYFAAIKELKPKEQPEFTFKIMKYVFEDEEPIFTDKQREQKLVWIGIVASLDKSKNKSHKKSN